MAYASRVSALTEELIKTFPQPSPVDDPVAFKRYKDAALQSIRHHKFGRTNQFSVQSSLEGLVEKFQVLDHEDLALALEARLTELSTWDSKWKPETLALLLHLSVDPVKNVKLTDLDSIQVPESSEEPEPKAKEILAEVSRENPSLWRDVDFRGGSSDEDDIASESQKSSEQTQDTVESAPANEHGSTQFSQLVALPDITLLEPIRDSQRWRTQPVEKFKIVLTELQAVRETLHMLQGLPTQLFQITKWTGNIIPSENYYIDHLSSPVFQSLLDAFAELGSIIKIARRFTDREHVSPIIQTFASGIMFELQAFDFLLTSIANDMINLQRSHVVSLSKVYISVKERARFLMQLEQLVPEIQALSKSSSYQVLDLLFARTCRAQETGEDHNYSNFAQLLLACLQTYLKPVKAWMQLGTLSTNTTSMFVEEKDHAIDVSSFWRSRHTICKDSNGKARVPAFLYPHVEDIFASGKSVAFLSRLGISEHPNIETEASTTKLDETILASTLKSDKEPCLVPFAVSLRRSLDTWTTAHSRDTTFLLHTNLFQEYGLMETVSALGHLYLGVNGFVSQRFAEQVFSRIDSGDDILNDPLYLEDLARDVFTRAAVVDVENISIYKSDSRRSKATKPQNQRSVQELSKIELKYRYSWPIANVLAINTLSVHQQVFTILLQVRRAISLLSSKQLLHAFAIKSPTIATLNSLRLSVRQHLLYAANAIASYLHDRIIQPNLNKLISWLEDSKSSIEKPGIDTILQQHEIFISKLQAQCLLSDETRSVKDAILTMMDVCVAFSDLFVPPVGKDHAKVQPVVEKEYNGHTSDGDADEEADSDDHHKSKHIIPVTGVESVTEIPKKIVKLRQIHNQLDRLLQFAIAGLRSAARAHSKQDEVTLQDAAKNTAKDAVEASEAWGILAEMLEWGLRSRNAEL